MKKIKTLAAVLLLSLVMALMMTGCGESSSEPVAKGYKDGTYSGRSSDYEEDESGNGAGYGTVELEIKDNKIYLKVDPNWLVNKHSDVQGTFNLNVQFDAEKIKTQTEYTFQFPGSSEGLHITFKDVNVTHQKTVDGDSWNHVVTVTKDESGNYKLQTMTGAANAGTTPGKYKVRFDARVGVDTGKTEMVSGKEVPIMDVKSVLPKKYNDVNTSGFEVEVKPGANTIDFDLKSK